MLLPTTLHLAIKHKLSHRSPDTLTELNLNPITFVDTLSVFLSDPCHHP